jgi:hypothetical protein
VRLNVLRRTKGVFQGDRDLIDLMLDAGEKLATRPRETTHYLHFASKPAAVEVADAARSLGFQVDVEGPEAGRNDFQVQARHTILVTIEAITAARLALTPVAESAGGVYDGWDTYADDALEAMRPN